LFFLCKAKAQKRVSVFSNEGAASLPALPVASPTESTKMVGPAASLGASIGALATHPEQHHHWAFRWKGAVLLPSLITGKEITLMNRNLVMSKPLVVVVDDPSFLASTQVQYVPHLGDRGLMTCAKELKP